MTANCIILTAKWVIWLAKRQKNNDQCGGRRGQGRDCRQILGLFSSSWGGVGVASVKIGQAEVGAIVAVNAFGDIFDCHNGRILAGAKLSLGEFLDTTNYMLNHDLSMYENKMGFNTTIGVVYTDAALDKEQVNKMASIAHDGLALSITSIQCGRRYYVRCKRGRQACRI